MTQLKYDTFSCRKSTALCMTTSTVKIVEPFGKGLSEDLKRKLPFYVSDFTDGFKIKSLSSTFFLFFACLAPAIAFGGLLALATGREINKLFTNSS